MKSVCVCVCVCMDLVCAGWAVGEVCRASNPVELHSVFVDRFISIIILYFEPLSVSTGKLTSTTF